MLRLFRKKESTDPSKETIIDSIEFPFIHRLWLRLSPFSGKIFFNKIILLSAKMAVVDGAVTQTELRLFTSLLETHFSLSKRHINAARKILFKAKENKESFSDIANSFYKKFKKVPVLLENAYDVLLSMAYADNVITLSEQELLKECAEIFKLNSDTLNRLIKRHHNWKTKFEYTVHETKKQSDRKHSHSSENKDRKENNKSKFNWKDYQKSNQQESKFKFDLNEKWFEVLGVDKNATVNEVKKAYRKLVQMYHPDRLPKDLPPEMVRSSVERFIEIQKAYDQFIGQK
jgi:DnaJ like chaperone protein